MTNDVEVEEEDEWDRQRREDREEEDKKVKRLRREYEEHLSTWKEKAKRVGENILGDGPQLPRCDICGLPHHYRHSTTTSNRECHCRPDNKAVYAKLLEIETLIKRVLKKKRKKK